MRNSFISCDLFRWFVLIAVCFHFMQQLIFVSKWYIIIDIVYDMIFIDSYYFKSYSSLSNNQKMRRRVSIFKFKEISGLFFSVYPLLGK